MKKGVSVIICSYNSENRIKHVLDCLGNQINCENIDWEVIMVDNASTDNVVNEAKNSWNHPRIPLRIFHEPRQGQSFATRTGFEKAEYDTVVMVDDDNYVSNNYISRAFEIMENHPEVGIAGGLGIGYFEQEPPDWFKDVEQGFAIGPQASQEGYVDDTRGYIYGAGSVIRKSVYDYLLNNGFTLMMKGRIGKSLVAAEDSERSLVFRILGYKLWYDPSLKFQHHMTANRINWNYTRKLFVSFGRASNYIDLYSEILNKPKGIKAFIKSNPFPNTLNYSYGLVKAIPSYLRNILKGSTVGNLEVVNFDFFYGRFIENIMNMSKIKRCRKQLKEADWRKKFSTADLGKVL